MVVPSSSVNIERLKDENVELELERKNYYKTDVSCEVGHTS